MFLLCFQYRWGFTMHTQHREFDLRQALQLTINEFGLVKADLAEKSDISESSISRFLSENTDLGSTRLQKVLDSLPPDAKSFYFALLNPNRLAMASDAVGDVSQHTSLVAMLKSHLLKCTQKEFMDILSTVIKSRSRSLQEEGSKGELNDTASQDLIGHEHHPPCSQVSL
jgi:hypothetical protein